MAINKIVYNNNTLIDLTSDTVSADKLVSGITAHDKSGAKITGTAVLNNVTQDQDGYIVLPPTGGGGGGISGLEYESGTWTPSSDTSAYAISFINAHTEAPFYFLISDVTGTYSDVTSTIYLVQYINFHQLYGEPHYIESGASNISYGVLTTRFRSSATAFNNATTSINTPYTDPADGTNGTSRYWAKETMINACTNSTTRYFRAGRTYKWIAVWAPTT